MFNSQKMSKFRFKNQFFTILAHLSGWCVFLCIPILFRRNEASSPQLNELPIELVFLFGSLLIVVYYTNFWLLIPRVLNRYDKRYYGLSVLVLWLAFVGISIFLKNFIFENNTFIPYSVFIFPFSLIVAMSLSIRLLTDKSQIEQQQKERENETLKSELSFLRSQISPHFLFNVMNNVVALSRVQPKKVEPTLIQLSQLMRYMLYSSDEKKVSIAKEIDYLESYIALQKLRFGDSVEVVFDKKGSFTEAAFIEPMLLIPFVENAFKHGIGFVKQPKINIALSISDNTLSFSVLNPNDTQSIDVKDSDSGIGLKNVSRRLDLLYSDSHSLNITNNNGIFRVDLIIKFNHKT
jgi:two-component system, LytTR family, sensor kinase